MCTCWQGLTELLLDQLPSESDSSPACGGWAGSPASCSGPVQDDSREAGEADGAEQDNECCSAACEPATELLQASCSPSSGTSSAAGRTQLEVPQPQTEETRDWT